MVNMHHKEVLNSLASKGAKPLASDAEHDDNDNGSSSGFEGLNYGGFTEEETKALRSMINKQVGKAIKNVMPYYISQTTNNIKEVIKREQEEFRKCGIMNDYNNEMTTYRNCKEKNKVNFASNFLCDSAKMWWEGKVERFQRMLRDDIREVKSPFKCTTLDDLLSRAQVREADILRKKNKEAKETKRKIEFRDYDATKPKHDQRRKSRGTLIKTPLSKVYRDMEIKIDDSVFKIELIPIVLRAFDIVIGMYWLDRMNTISKENASKTDDTIDKLADQISTLVDIVSKKVVTPATVKAVEESCVTCSASTSGTLPSNTIPNPKGEMKAITTRSGIAYEGPSIPTKPSLKKVVERETEETMDKEQTNFQGSTAHIQPLVIPIPEPDVLKTLPKPNILYPSRVNDQKLHEKATNQMEKFFQIFQDLHFNISFADALLLMPKFASTIKSLFANKDKLFELAKIPLNENCSVMLLKKLPEKLGDPDKFLIPCDFSRMDWIIIRPKGVAEDVFVKVRKFHFPTDFVVVDFEADPCVPLILRRSFLRTGRALIDVYGKEITLRVNDEAITSHLNQTTRYSSTYDDMSINRIDIIDVAGEEYAQEMIGFSNNFSGGNPTSTFEPIISDSSPSLTPFEGIKAKSSIEEHPELKLKDLPSHLEYAYLEGIDKLPVKITDIKGIDPRFCTHKILMEEDYKPAVQSQRWVNHKIHDVIKKEVMKLLDEEMIYLISDSSWVSPIYCVPKKGGITVVENENNDLIPTRFVTDTNLVLNWEKCHFMVKEGIVLGHKIYENGLEVDQAKVNVIAKLAHPMTPIHYASKTMTEAQIHYTTTEKEMLAVAYDFEKFRPYLVLSKSIVYTDHSALKYLLSKQDAKPRLLRWVLLLQEFDIIIRDEKGMENLMADHLSRLENPHKYVFENKDINENFRLETLGKISSGSTPWFPDFANFHAENFIVKGMSSQQKKKLFKDVKHYFWDDPYHF
nr:reverse transcriptase domain-containing protein [Tanacetum cinerariifolium]